MVECLRTFMIQDDNLYGLALLDQLEETLQPYMNEMQKNPALIAIMFLLTNRKELFYNAKEPRIQQLFGNMPFNKLQNCYKVCSLLHLFLLLFYRCIIFS